MQVPTRIRLARLAHLFPCAACCGLLALAIAPVRADDAQDHFNAGVKLYQGRKTDEALSEFKTALRLAPRDATILRWIGFLELERQNYQAAREPLERAVQLDPNSVVAHLDLGNVYDGLKQYPSALEEFRKVTRLKPDSADAFYDIGLTYSKLGRWAEAAEALNNAARLDAAAAHGAAGMREDPAIQDALGYALMNTGDVRGARDAYQRAVSLAPDNAEFNYHLALAWRRLADEHKAAPETALANARRALKVAVDRTPGNFEFTELYGEILFDMDQNAEAAVQFARAAEMEKTQYNPVYNLAVAYTRLGVSRQADAERAYARALSLVKPGDDPSYRRNALSGLASTQIRLRRYDDAIGSLKTLTAEFPSDTSGWVNLATAYRFKGDENGEIDALRGALANSSGYANIAQVHAALGALLYRRGETSAALDQYAAANRARPNNADILNGLALAEEKAGRHDDAIRDFQAAVRINPRFADAYNNLGVAYIGRYNESNSPADLDRAIAAYNQALAIDPHHALALRNKERYEKAKHQ
ncbi:MAG TPA: tetratricopeptide repeat protein [Chthonomonadaceae bacterium]|nr:tetratricopeptide repeat protein [Chthonomonadaceae bacterium]